MPISPQYRMACFAVAILLHGVAAASATVPLRVAGFNVENGLYPTNTPSYQDTELILSRINADVVGLCELMVTTTDGQPVSDQDNFPALGAALGLPFTVLDDNPTPHRAGIASRYPISQTIWVNGAGMTRRIPLVRIDVPGAAKPVWVAMLHLKARHSDGSEQHTRAAELFWLRQAILANCNVQSDSIVIMGDFNLVSPQDAVFTTPLYAGVTYPLSAPKDADDYFVPEQIFKIDARHAGPAGETYTWLGDSRFGPGALDHIMVNAPLRALGVASEIYDIQKDASGIDGLPKYGPRPPPSASYGSDHLPIFADLNLPEIAPSVEFTRRGSGTYAAGSSFFINARLGANTVGADFYINGRPVTAEQTTSGDIVSFRWTPPSTGLFAFQTVARSSSGLLAESAQLSLTILYPFEPLPSVAMLPLQGTGVPTSAGTFFLLRANAAFPSAEGVVEFYADGVYIGTARKTAAGTYELPWLKPNYTSTVSITAQAVATYALPGEPGGQYWGASISRNDIKLTTEPFDDATLAAGRTKFEVVVKNLTWPEAHADAIASGGHLATFDNGTSYDRVIADARKRYTDALWIGLADQNYEGFWEWIDGSPLDERESRWNAGEPNDWNGGEDYVHIWWGSNVWNDNSGKIPAYLIEKAPRNLSALPFAAGGWSWSLWSGADAADTKDAALAMTADSESSWREYTFNGPVKVRFQWKVSSEAGDTFSYAVNGATIKSISGETAWSTETIKLPAGTHTIRWTYSKDASGSAGFDAGFLDCLEFWNDAASPLGVKLGENAATFAVWAPNATAVSVVGSFNNWTETPLESDAATGHWTGTVPGAKHGDEYQYLIRWPGNESGRLKNDPRADWIRNGRSVVYDHSAFDWGAGFVPREDETGLVYELHIGAFNNTSPQTKTVATFDDAIQRLDYLQQLGVDIIALMPITEYETTTSWGYNPAYLFAVENDYGGPDALKRFVKAAHARGMKVQLDIVHNHYIQEDYLDKGNYPTNGPGLLDFDGPEDIYFYGRNNHLSGHPDQPKRAAYNWGPRPDFSQPEVRRYVEDNVRHWLDNYRIDGFRWDSPNNILGYDSDGKTPEPDTLLPEAKAMMADINRMIHEQYPGRWSIAEEPGLLVTETPSSFPQFYRDAAAVNLLEEFDGHWQYGFYEAARNNLASPSPDVWGMLQRVMNISEKPATRVVFTDTHDLAGDLNDGLRWPHRVGEADPDSKTARKKSLLGAVLALTAPGSPMLLMGQEFHATGAFGDRIPLDWSKAAINHRLFRAYRDLIDLRRDFASVRKTALSSNFGANNGLGVGRYWRGNDVVVVFNMSSQPRTDAGFYFPAGGQWFVRINTDSTIYGEDFDGFGPARGVVNVTAPDNSAVVPLAPYSAVVLTRTPPLPATEDFVHGFTHVNEPGADDYLIETTNVRKYSEWQNPPITYWSTSANDTDASVTYKFTRPGPILSGSVLVNLASFNFDWGNRNGWSGSGVGTSSLYASKDGNNWFLLKDNPTPVNWVDSYVSFDGPLPTEVLGSRDLWLQVRMRTSGAPLSGYSTAQFGRASAANASNVFQVQLQSATAAHEDSDGDGLADSWETITGSTDPHADDDADGLTNLREYLSGLNPKLFNPDAVVGSFNDWNPTASPLTVTAGNPTQRGHLRFSRTAQSGQFRWLLAGIYYGGTQATPDLVEGGAPIAYEAPAGTYIYFSAGADPASAAVAVIDPANPLDADNNQLDDRWQTFYGVNDPNGDADGDTMSNLREFLRGTDPLVAGAPAVVGDRLPLAWTPDAQDLQMTWSEKRQRWEWVGVLAPGPVEFKFAMGPGWLGENHGRGNLPGTTDTAGGTDKNIVADLVASGRHRFSFNELTRTYSLEFFPPRQEWRERHSLPADGSWTDDSDGDGMNDLLEYALGGNPRLGGAQSLGPAPRAPLESAHARSTGREMIFSWIQTNDPAVVVMPQVRADLTIGVWTDAVSEIDPNQTNVTADHVRKMVRVPGSSGRHFLRLNVSLP